MLKNKVKSKVKETDYAVINKHTGEVIADYELKQDKPKKQSYVLMFYTYISDRNLSLNPIMIKIIGFMDSKNMIRLDKPRKDYIAKNMHVNDNVIRITITRMCKAAMLINLGQSVYFANPYYFSKSNLSKTAELQREFADLQFSTPARKALKKKVKELADNVIKLAK